ncbi:hypothetical protein EXU85_21865 [Spirosoma sp. KCTC 42546]|uniref:hypothetical protein n=1 Tax=Spirosoma sp. KCTC 42546 TaxID=2520506 RepID=UPI00115B4348|nr:hypothetical protein [Spirosoma sp. KCTC 42546]QDK81116.1 hypothetical protein EXU85_21865 [Spirosoma sp. KCTC 42546]
MELSNLYSSVNRQLEKLAFLVEASEGVYGLYEFLLTIGYYDFLTIVGKYAIAYDLLKELLLEDLIVLEEFTDPDLKQKIRNVELTEVELILNQPFSWYTSSRPMYSVAITAKGEAYIEAANEIDLKKLERRFLYNDGK